MNSPQRSALFAVFGSAVLLASCAPSLPRPVSAHAQTLGEVSVPEPVLDSQTRVSRSGVLESLGPGGWAPLAGKNLPQRTLAAGSPPVPRALNSFLAVSPQLWTITTPFEGLYSTDQGASWTLLVQREKLATNAYLTTLAASPADPRHWVLGTTFHGVFESRDGGKTWTNVPDIYTLYNFGADYHEPVNALVFSQRWPGVIYASCGKEGERVYRYNLDTGVADTLVFPGGSYLNFAQSLAVHQEGNQEILEARTDSAWWRYATETRSWLKLKDRTDFEAWDEAKRARMQASKDRWGLYIHATQAAKPAQLSAHLDFMAKNGLNALVVDMKDDRGELCYDSQVPLAKTIGAVKGGLDLPALVKSVHARGFYLIARQVVFKDKKLFAYDGNKYALWDKVAGAPWVNYETKTADDGTETLVPKEFWVDTFAPDVWAYNAAIAKELQDLGVDEVQFDYIRFPSDGAIKRITNRFEIPGMNRLDALEGFLKTARESLTIPISVDIYGFNGYFVADYLGQNMTMMSKYVDSISPMFYPSHFFKPFLWNLDYLDRARVIYQDGSDRTWLGTQGRVNVRPWVQAFLLGNERNYPAKKYEDYLEKQLTGVKSSKASGFLLWNNSNDYYMVKQTVAPYQSKTVLP